jgi:hypothetical protein
MVGNTTFTLKPPGFAEFFRAYYAAASQAFVTFTKKMLQNMLLPLSTSLPGYL